MLLLLDPPSRLGGILFACARRLVRLLPLLIRWAVEVTCCMRVVDDARVGGILVEDGCRELDDAFGSQSCRCDDELDLIRGSPPLDDECLPLVLLGALF